MNKIITFGSGIHCLRKLNIWDDDITLITELVYYTLNKKNIILFKLEVETNVHDYGKDTEYETLDMGLTIHDYLMKYQTIDERKIIAHYVFVGADGHVWFFVKFIDCKGWGGGGGGGGGDGEGYNSDIYINIIFFFIWIV